MVFMGTQGGVFINFNFKLFGLYFSSLLLKYYNILMEMLLAGITYSACGAYITDVIHVIM